MTTWKPAVRLGETLADPANDTYVPPAGVQSAT